LNNIRVLSCSFAAQLQAWYLRHHRDLPWRRTSDPYRIWISEIMLQQTRAQAVIPYYEKFLKRFPTVRALGRASESEVLACWSGLGYYSRARNLLEAARRIVAAGRFPDRYESIRRLPGVGPYTAASIASIAFDLPYAVLDGNVMRVIARLTNDAADIGSAATKARFQHMAQTLLDARHPGRFNQAIMELGATVCLPRAPRCPHCPVAQFCEARLRGAVNQLPVKLGGPAPERIDAILAVVERKGKILLWRRPADSRRMAGFWELPAPDQLPGLRGRRTLGAFRHTITHHHYTFTLISGTLARPPRGLRWFGAAQLREIPLSTTARKALKIYLR
jgi:A/G-specific adenine glycosylase